MLDKLSPANRHMVIALIGAVLGELSNQLPSLNVPAPVAPVVGMLLTTAVLRLTALTKQYDHKG